MHGYGTVYLRARIRLDTIPWSLKLSFWSSKTAWFGWAVHRGKNWQASNQYTSPSKKDTVASLWSCFLFSREGYYRTAVDKRFQIFHFDTCTHRERNEREVIYGFANLAEAGSSLVALRIQGCSSACSPVFVGPKERVCALEEVCTDHRESGQQRKVDNCMKWVSHIIHLSRMPASHVWRH